jgi:hypothetical protein
VKSAHSDHPKAARVPMEMRVSMVAAPWRRLVRAARWNGQPQYTTTGEARVRASHCQPRNWSAGTIDMAITGTASTSAVSRRLRSGSGCAAGRSAGAAV